VPGKIQSQAGDSLSDTYSIRGSKVGVEQLNFEDVNLVDEMGGRVHSERLQSFFVTLTVTVGQSLDFNITAGGIPDSVNRVLGVFAVADTSPAILQVQLAILENGGPTREMPIWVWDNTSGLQQPIRWADDGELPGDEFALTPPIYTLPQLVTRTGAGKLMPDLLVRGTTTGFGAGMVRLIVMVHLARPDPGNPTPGHPSSHGLPVPSW